LKGIVRQVGQLPRIIAWCTVNKTLKGVYLLRVSSFNYITDHYEVHLDFLLFLETRAKWGYSKWWPAPKPISLRRGWFSCDFCANFLNNSLQCVKMDGWSLCPEKLKAVYELAVMAQTFWLCKRKARALLSNCFRIDNL